MRPPHAIIEDLEKVRRQRRFADLPGLAEQEAALAQEWKDAIYASAMASHTADMRETLVAVAEGEPGKWSVIEEYWRNPAPFDAEEAARKAAWDASWAKHDARVRAEREARWAREEAGL